MKTLITTIILITILAGCKDVTKGNGDLICLGIPAPNSEEKEKIKEERTQKKAEKSVEKTVKIEDLIPAGYSIVNTKEGEEIIRGDLNKDGQEDLAVLIEMRGDSTYDQSEKVLLVIYTADRHKQLQMAAATNNLGGESVSYNEVKKLSAKKGVLSYHHQSMRHHIDLKFRYDINAGGFRLIGKDYADYGGMNDGPRKVSINYLTGLKLIDQSTWDEQTEEVVALPQEKEQVSKELISLSAMDWDSMYDDL